YIPDQGKNTTARTCTRKNRKITDQCTTSNKDNKTHTRMPQKSKPSQLQSNIRSQSTQSTPPRHPNTYPIFPVRQHAQANDSPMHKPRQLHSIPGLQ
ncbi:Hypothetical predicted protein, partial [Pelobates cultripes]